LRSFSRLLDSKTLAGKATLQLAGDVRKTEAASLANIDLRKVEDHHLPVPDSSVDLALVAIVLYGIPEKDPFIFNSSIP